MPCIMLEAAPISFSIPKYSLSLKERETVAACLVLEAANQGDFGMRSVMAVIRNRAREGCFRAFRHNNWVGLVIFAGIVLSYLLPGLP